MSDTKKMIDGLFEYMFGGEEAPTTHEVSASDEVGAPILTAITPAAPALSAWRYECSCGERHKTIDGAKSCRKCRTYLADYSRCVDVVDLATGETVWESKLLKQEAEEAPQPEPEPTHHEWVPQEGEHPATVRSLETLNKANLWLSNSLDNALKRLSEVEDKLASTESHVASLVRRQAEVDNLIKGLRELLHAAQ